MSIDPNVAYWGDRCSAAEAEVRRLQVEIVRLRDALLFYAEETIASEDGGKRAREALKG